MNSTYKLITARSSLIALEAATQNPRTTDWPEGQWKRAEVENIGIKKEHEKTGFDVQMCAQANNQAIVIKV